MLRVVFPYTLNPMNKNIEFTWRYASKISILDWCNPKYWPNLVIGCVLYLHTVSTQLLQIMNLFGVVFQNTKKWYPQI